MQSLRLIAASIFLSANLVAHADDFSFSFGTSSSIFSGSGVFTTGSMVAPGEYIITGATGTAETQQSGASAITLLAPGVFPTPTNGGTFPANDNVLFVFNGVGTLSQDGVSFLLGNGTQINLYNGGAGNDAFLEGPNGVGMSEALRITVAPVAPVTATPEPSSIALLGTGFMGVVGVMRRRLRA